MDRKPYFLYAALSVPALWIAYIILAGAISSGRSGSDLGNWGRAMEITLGALVASDITGFFCSCVSVARRERLRGLGILCLGIYGLPLVLAVFIAVLQFGATKGQQAMNEENRQAHPERFSH